MKKSAPWLTDRVVIGAGLIFSLLNVLFIVTENFWGLILPLVVALVFAVIFALDKVLLFLVFSTPLSIFYFNKDLHVGFTLPTEPILFGVMLLFMVKLLYRGSFDPKVVWHPISLAVLFNLLWMFFTTLSSELPLVSFKYFLARLTFVSVFFYLMSQVLKSRKGIKAFFWLYMIPLAGVVIYTLSVHAQHDFSGTTSTWVMFPFFKEHTSYGAVLAMYIPIAFVFAFLLKHNLNLKLLGSLIFVILTAGVIFSYTRAAWLSLVVACGLMVLILIKPRRDILIFTTLTALAFLWYFRMDIQNQLEQNEKVSSDNFADHVSSMSNMSTDASNMERINRWKAAFRMFMDKPWLGHGPGTYMFLYAPYQKPYDKTIISTNAGSQGNAHSEYIGPLAESGVLGTLSVLVLVAVTIIYGIRVYYKLDDPELRYIALAALMGLVTYWTHGFLNNFLDMDKAACPVWGFSALLVVLDRYQKKIL